AVKISDVKLVFTTAEPGSEGQNGGSEDPAVIKADFSIVNAVKTFQVFDMQGKLVGRVDVSNGTNLKDALMAKFQKAGVYMLKSGSKIQKVSIVK
ncbi:MAG: T9SS type A sorting domain-containing protein, partial [Candidatus Saccharibacteria bacterium]|nr:T9SS type A sorting domain-containing protein [Candidatus Saccharibacteria bacterium]